MSASKDHGKILFDVSDEELVNFWVGAPHKSMLPTQLLEKAMKTRFTSADFWTNLQYGPPKGQPWVLEELAKFLRAEYRDDSVSERNLMMTTGASQSVFNLLAWLTDKNTVIFVEDPTYFVFPEVLKDQGVDKSRIVIVPTDDSGADVDFIELYLASHTPAKSERYPYFYYTVATFSNPTGKSLSADRAQKLVELSSKYDVLVVCDDVYPMLYYTETPPQRVFKLSDRKNGLIISNCSFSKILAPGMRVGWIEASEQVVATLAKRGLLSSGGGVAQASSAIVAEVLKSGDMAQHLAYLRRTFAARVDKVYGYLTSHLDTAKVHVEKPLGGYFFWLELPSNIDTAQLLKALQHAVASATGGTPKAATHMDSDPSETKDDSHLINGKPVSVIEKIAFAPGSHFSLSKNFKNCMRLSFTFYEESTLMSGVEKLCKLLSSIL